MILLSGKNSFFSLMRWRESGIPIFFDRIPYRQPIWFQSNPYTIENLMKMGFDADISYGFNLVSDGGVGTSYPSPPIESITVNTSFGVEPHLMLGKLFPLDFHPVPIEGRNISVRGYLTTEFLSELLYPIAKFVEYRRRLAYEPTPEYAIQITTVSHLPEFSNYVFVIEAPIAVPQRISISANSQSFVTFDVSFFTPYASWYVTQVSKSLPTTFDAVYSSNVYTIREMEIAFDKGAWWTILGFPYEFSFTATKEISPVYTFPQAGDGFPLVAREWGSVAQSIKEGAINMEAEIVYYLPSDANLPIVVEFIGRLGGGHLYSYSRLSYPITLRLSPFHFIRATAQVASLTSSHSPSDVLRIGARLLLAEVMEVWLGS